MHVSKPYLSPLGGKWVIRVTESRSPLSKVIETLEFTSREAAWQGYRQVMKDLGKGL